MVKKVLLTQSKFRELYSEFKDNFGWRSHIDKGIVLENSSLGTSIRYYGLCSQDDKLLYDTIAIREREGNSVVIITNQNGEIGLLYEYRPIPDKYFHSCVRGFANEKETGVMTAIREMFEEAGNFDIIKTKSLGLIYQNTTFFEVPINVFLIEVTYFEKKETVNNKLKKNQNEEMIESFHFYNTVEVLNMIRLNTIQCQITLSALMLFFSQASLAKKEGAGSI